jgi:hypothetical protein
VAIGSLKSSYQGAVLASGVAQNKYRLMCEVASQVFCKRDIEIHLASDDPAFFKGEVL